MNVSIYHFINNICGLHSNNRKFPGGLPVSLERTDIPTLFGYCPKACSEYTLSYKADGENGGRYFLGFLDVDGDALSFLIDRNFKITFLKSEIYNRAYRGSVFDVELVRNSDQSYLILIFDTLAINGNIVMSQYYPTRLEIAREFIQRIVNHLGKSSIRITCSDTKYNYKSNRTDYMVELGFYNHHKVNLKVKKIYYTTSLHLLKGCTLFPTDGFIWTKTTCPYMLFRSNQNTIFKWKPLEVITIDFLVECRLSNIVDTSFPNIDNIPSEYRITTGNILLFTEYDNQKIAFTFAYSCNLQKSGIYECYWVNDHWVIGKQRTDKTKPNQLETVSRTIGNYIENISKDEICDYYI